MTPPHTHTHQFELSFICHNPWSRMPWRSPENLGYVHVLMLELYFNWKAEIACTCDSYSLWWESEEVGARIEVSGISVCREEVKNDTQRERGRERAYRCPMSCSRVLISVTWKYKIEFKRTASATCLPLRIETSQLRSNSHYLFPVFMHLHVERSLWEGMRILEGASLENNSGIRIAVRDPRPRGLWELRAWHVIITRKFAWARSLPRVAD